jgi:hypothetical protein
LFWNVRATLKSGSTVAIDCVGSAKPGGRLASVPGKAGAPALVGLTATV